MKSNASLLYSCFLVVGDFLALVAAFAGAYVLRVSVSHRPLSQTVHAHTYLSIFLTLLPFWILIFALLGLYNSSIYEKRFGELGRLLIGSFIGLLFVIGLTYLLDKPIFPARLVPIYGFIFGFIFLVVFRNLARTIRSTLFRYDIGITNLLVIGDTSVARELVSELHDSKHSGYRIVGVVGLQAHMAQKKLGRIKTFVDFKHAIAKLGAGDIHSIVQTELYAEGTKNNAILDFAQSNHISYRFIPGNTELFVGNIAVELFRSSIPVIAVHQTSLIGWGRIVKRLFDIFVSLVSLIILSPVFLVISIMILVVDPGAVFFKQERITRYNHKFPAYKFRTMKRKYSGRDPVEVFAELGRKDLVEAFNKAQKITNDPRISSIGLFLRRYSLDELPQLINILKGDMSLVGPRAVVPEELKFYEDKSPLLLSIKTGLTGLAQVSGRSNLDYYERAKLDLYYVQNWSFWLDITILIKTVRVLFYRSGVR